MELERFPALPHEDPFILPRRRKMVYMYTLLKNYANLVDQVKIA